MPARGDIVLARFPFTDQSGVKLRPVLLLVEIPGAYRDFVVMFISSRLAQATPGLDLVLQPGHPAFLSSGLKVASVFRVGKIASLSEALFVGTLGRLDPTLFEEIVRRLTAMLESGQVPGAPPV